MGQLRNFKGVVKEHNLNYGNTNVAVYKGRNIEESNPSTASFKVKNWVWICYIHFRTQRNSHLQ